MIGPQRPGSKPLTPPLEPELRVSPARDFKPSLSGKAETMGGELARVLNEPGDKLNLMSGHRFGEIRSKLDLNVPYVGLHAQKGLAPTAQDVPNPDSPDGQWDPTQFMPRLVFDRAEDAFPVAPDFDGTASTKDNSPSTPGGEGGSYRDGVIGGKQPLSGAFTVTKKGDYTVLTYSFYHAHNKAMGYHQNDYSTAQVYLKPGADGKLAPTHLMTSWHHGAVLTPWNDMAKDANGRPIVKVNLGSHSLEVMDKGAKPPSEGLQIAGDGQAMLNGKPTGHTLHFEALQTNIKGARYLDPTSEEAKPRLEAMRWGDAAMNPLLPQLFEEATPFWQEVGMRGLNAAKDKAADGLEAAKDKAEELASDGVGAVKKGWSKLKGLF